MPGHAADRNMLFGIVALQMELITRDALITAMGAWALEKHRPIGEILVEQGALDPVDRSDLEPMIDRRIAREGGDPAKSLAGLTSATSLAAAIRRSFADPDVLGSHTYVAEARTHLQGEAEAEGPAGADRANPTGARYRKILYHAEGGLGIVYVAKDEELNREVALKEIKPRFADNPTSQSRFLMEAEITGGLEHPGIVPVYGLGHYDDGRPFYAMRFIKGDSLKDAIADFHADQALKADPGERTLALQKLLRRFLDVCNAVAYAHSRGVLHRDLKPDNVMVGRYGETLVVDWGLAKAIGRSPDLDPSGAEATLVPSSASGSDDTLPGSVIGTPAYMSPEQAAGRLDLLGPASDVYSLGATLFALLTGQAPITGKDVAEVIKKVEHGEVPRPRERSPWLDVALEAICLKAMALRPDDRYASPRSLAEDLERWIADEPVTACKESVGTRLRRWSGRNRTLVTAAASLLVTAVVALTIATILINEQRSKAAEQSRLRGIAVSQTKVALDRAREAAALAEAAEDRATAESSRAKDEAAKVVSVVSVLVNSFRSSDPIGLEGYGLRASAEVMTTLTAREILERSARLIDQNLIDRPLVRATLMDTIGDVYHSMAELDRAAPLLEEALKIRAGLLAWDDPDLATSLIHLGRLKQDRADFDGAERDYRDALERRTKRFGAFTPEVMSVKLLLGILWLFEIENDRAEPVFREIIEKFGPTLGESNRDVAIARLGLAAALFEKNQAPEALLQSRKAIGAILSRADAEQFLLMIGKFQAGFTFNSMGQPRLAERLFRECYKGMQGIIGPEHPYLAYLDLEIGRARESIGDDIQAEASYRRCLDLIRRSGGIRQPRARNAVDSFGKFLVKKKRLDEAEALYGEYLRVCREGYGDDHIWVADALVLMAHVPSRRGDFDEVLRIYRQALAIYRSRTDHNPAFLELCLNNLALELHRRGQFGQAEPLYREALPISRKRAGDRTAQLGVILDNLAKCLMDQNRFDDEVVRLLDEAHQIVRLPVQVNYELGLSVRSHLAILNYRLGAFDRAEGPARDALETARRVFAAAPLKQIEHLRTLAGVSIANGEVHRVIPLLEEAAALASKAGGANSADSLIALSLLALAREADGDHAGHRQALATMAGRSSAVADPARLAMLTWTLARFPEPPIAADRLEALARQTLAAGPGLEFNQLAGSAALLRAGKVEEAARLLETIRKPRKEFPYCDHFLAVAYHQLGRLDESRAAASRVIAWVERPEKLTRNWDLLLVGKLFRRELAWLNRDFNADLPQNVFAP
jgi:tetratricopeptide (TPR) repeat protein/tRNA A-37 threonylcarbamoyl transferase component Bud32